MQAVPLLARASFGLLLATTAAAHAVPACTAQSPAHSVALVELYTSEGCSSCPPADKWLSRFTANRFPTDRVVPLAFHIDYWDYLGWRDRFASPVFGARQREQVERQRARFAYTPQIILDGHDWRGWGDEAGLRRELDRVNARPSPLQLHLTAAATGERRLEVDLHAAGEKAAGTRVYLALYESGLESRVTAGENENVRLHHDYVVRRLVGPIELGAQALDRHESIALPPDLKLPRAGLVAFSEPAEETGARQAVALALAGCVADESGATK